MTQERQAGVSLCSLRVGDQRFGIGTEQVHEVLGNCLLHRVPLAPEYVAGVIPYRGEVLLTLSFRSLLELPPLDEPESVLVLPDEQEGVFFGLAVDAVEEVLTLRAEDFEENPCTLKERRKALFAGAYKSSESVVVRLEVEKLLPARLMEIVSREENEVMERDRCAF